MFGLVDKEGFSCFSAIARYTNRKPKKRKGTEKMGTKGSNRSNQGSIKGDQKIRERTKVHSKQQYYNVADQSRVDGVLMKGRFGVRLVR